jgi:YegS/Rv2252/BmrU family lipid kinase
MMLAIHFIVNPIAGYGHHKFSETILKNYFEADKYCVTIKSSDYKGHAIDLAKESINQKANIIVACGGDGTINEVASALVGTSIPLGIVPFGSGNGLASNLNIPKNVKKALNIIKNNNQTRIDVGCINDRYFFSNSGFGFTASAIKNYEVLKQRTLLSYIKSSLKSFKEFNQIQDNIININGTSEIVNPFLIFISNSNIMGYNFSLTPKASLQDGLLDVIIIPKISKLKILCFGLCMLINKPQLLKEVNYFQTKAILLSKQQFNSFESQIDGEFVEINQQSLSIFLKEKALKVIVC